MFKADGNEASFDYGDDSDVDVLARGAAVVRAYSNNPGPDTKDDDQAYSYLLLYYGDWTD